MRELAIALAFMSSLWAADWQLLITTECGPASHESVENAARLVEGSIMIPKSSHRILCEDLASFYDDPLAYVMYAFPWGEPGTWLSNYSGPREWQAQFLRDLGAAIKERGFDGINAVAPIQFATSSGHGIGKSAMTAMVIKFIMDTRPHCKGVVTANSAPQLRTKTWAELGKWHAISLTEPFFEYRNSPGNMSLSAIESPNSWRVDAQTCRKENAEAFAGLHAANSTPFYVLDEASAIPEEIWTVAHGGLTDGEPMFIAWGNPTRTTGSFRECWGRRAHRWNTRQIDSRTVEGTNKQLFEEWAKDYGESSDFFKVRVKGEFPSASVCQLIPTDLVVAARGKHLRPDQYSFAPVILGVDVAWEGDDRSVIFKRQGLSASLLWEGREVDSISLAGLVAQFSDEHKAAALFIDAGYGTGVIDQLRHLGRNPIPVWFGGKSIRNDCANKRAEMWVNLRDWLRDGGAIPDNADLETDLTAPEYSHNLNGQIILEKKADMKKRGLSSPDLADGLALTFAQPVAVAQASSGRQSVASQDYDLMG